MNVCFAFVGAEGSAHDSMVLQWSKFLECVPDDFYVLTDAGYGLSKKVLTPYRSVRYHLKEWAKSSGRPRNGKELYNLCHAKARNVIERVIGVMKRRFKVLRVCMDYEFINIKAVIFACFCVHNFIRMFDESDLAEDFADQVHQRRLDRTANEDDAPISFDFRNGTAWRDWMSTAMWTEYQKLRANNSDIDSDDELVSDVSSERNSSTSDEELVSDGSSEHYSSESDDFDGSDMSDISNERMESDEAMSEDGESVGGDSDGIFE